MTIYRLVNEAITGESIRLTACKTRNDIILTENTTGKVIYIFIHHRHYVYWRKEEQNETWWTVARIIAKRKREEIKKYCNSLSKNIPTSYLYILQNH